MLKSYIQSQFSMTKIIRIFLIFFFIVEYDFRGTLFVDIFWKPLLYFLKWRQIFDKFYSTERKTQKLFKGLVVSFGPKGMSGRMCDSVR